MNKFKLLTLCASFFVGSCAKEAPIQKLPPEPRQLSRFKRRDSLENVAPLLFWEASEYVNAKKIKGAQATYDFDGDGQKDSVKLSDNGIIQAGSRPLGVYFGQSPIDSFKIVPTKTGPEVIGYTPVEDGRVLVAVYRLRK